MGWRQISCELQQSTIKSVLPRRLARGGGRPAGGLCEHREARRAALRLPRRVGGTLVASESI